MSFIKFLNMVQYNLLFSLIPGTHSQFTNLVNVVKKTQKPASYATSCRDMHTKMALKGK